jgi:uncharacterized protein (DUF736 family)
MEQKNNTGAIFKHEKTADNQPDYRGKMTVDGKQWEISLWVRESQAGKKYMSAAIKEPYVKPDESAPTQKPTSNDSDDGMPF